MLALALSIALQTTPAAPLVNVRELAADADYIDDKSGDAGVLFEARNVSLKGLAPGKRVIWTLFVKRKLAPWTSARNFPFAETRTKTADDVVKVVAAPLLHMTLAQDRFLPGEHEAALVGSVDGKDLVRVEVPFVLRAGHYRPHAQRR